MSKYLLVRSPIKNRIGKGDRVSPRGRSGLSNYTDVHSFSCYSFNSSEVWRIKLSESVIDIAHLPGGGRVFAALADGSIALLKVRKINSPFQDFVFLGIQTNSG